MRVTPKAGAGAAALLMLAACELGGPSRTYQNTNGLDPESADATVTGLAVGDVDGDGDDDIVSTGYHYGWSTLLNQGDGTFAAGSASPVMGSSAYRFAESSLVDVNGDAVLDLVMRADASASGSDVFVWIGDGEGNFAWPYALVGERTPIGHVVVDDVTGDGRPDVVRSGGDRLFVWAGLPGGGLADPVVTAGVGEISLATGDLNGDGRADVVAGTTGDAGVDAVTPWLAVGDGTFVPGATVVVDVPTGADRSPQLAVGDVDGDGDADVVASTTVFLLSLLGDGAGGLSEPVRTELTGDVPGPMALADFDADGVLDVATADRRSRGGGFVVFGDGTGRFEDRLGMPMPAGARPTPLLVAAAVAGDARPDLLLPGYGVRVVTNALDGRTRPAT